MCGRISVECFRQGEYNRSYRLVARVYPHGIYVGRVAWIESFNNGFANVVVQDLNGLSTYYSVPLAAIEIDSE